MLFGPAESHMVLLQLRQKCNDKSYGIGIKRFWVQNLALLFATCANMAQFLELFVPHFSLLQQKYTGLDNLKVPSRFKSLIIS